MILGDSERATLKRPNSHESGYNNACRRCPERVAEMLILDDHPIPFSNFFACLAPVDWGSVSMSCCRRRMAIAVLP